MEWVTGKETAYTGNSLAAPSNDGNWVATKNGKNLIVATTNEDTGFTSLAGKVYRVTVDGNSGTYTFKENGICRMEDPANNVDEERRYYLIKDELIFEDDSGYEGTFTVSNDLSRITCSDGEVTYYYDLQQ